MSENDTALKPVQEGPSAQEDQAVNAGLVKLSKPYTFEGKTYTEIDLSGIAEMTGEDMAEAEKFLTRTGTVSPLLPEMTMEYACFIANRATGLPVEFFKRLPAKDAVKVKNRVTSFFYGVG